MKYKAAFRGRMKDAIGIRYQIYTDVTGDDEKDAELNLYDLFEHISNLKLIAVVREFKIGDIVHFQAYKDCTPIEAKVIDYGKACFNDEEDDRVFYCLSGVSNPLTSTTTGKSIVESNLFSPIWSKDCFKEE